VIGKFLEMEPVPGTHFHAVLTCLWTDYKTAHNKRRGILVEFAKNRTDIELERYGVKSHEPFGTLHVL